MSQVTIQINEVIKLLLALVFNWFSCFVPLPGSWAEPDLPKRILLILSFLLLHDAM